MHPLEYSYGNVWQSEWTADRQTVRQGFGSEENQKSEGEKKKETAWSTVNQTYKQQQQCRVMQCKRKKEKLIISPNTKALALKQC